MLSFRIIKQTPDLLIIREQNSYAVKIATVCVLLILFSGSIILLRDWTQYSYITMEKFIFSWIHETEISTRLIVAMGVFLLASIGFIFVLFILVLVFSFYFWLVFNLTYEDNYLLCKKNNVFKIFQTNILFFYNYEKLIRAFDLSRITGLELDTYRVYDADYDGFYYSSPSKRFSLYLLFLEEERYFLANARELHNEMGLLDMGRIILNFLDLPLGEFDLPLGTCDHVNSNLPKN